MIFYFSATGNSKYVAKQLAINTSDALISITEAVHADKYTYATKAGESLGFVVPVYFYGIPDVVVKFIEKLV